MSAIDGIISKQFRRRIAGAFGADGEVWLAGLPEILEYVSDKWKIQLDPPFQPLSYNYVAPASDNDGNEFVLKAGVPNREFTSEIEALRFFDGIGAARLVKSDDARGLMLLERLIPGDPLEGIDDDERTTLIFADVLTRLHKPAPASHSFASIRDWFRGFERVRHRFGGQSGPIFANLFHTAEANMRELMASSSNEVVLHGDLHHRNILSSERGRWLAIDPKGVVGEAAYETGAWLRNPYPQLLAYPKLKRTLDNRIEVLKEKLGYDRDRIVGWAFSQAVLSAIWSLEEGHDEWKDWIELAKVFAEFR